MISVNFSLFEEHVATVIGSIPISGKVFHSLTEQMIGFINLQFHQKDAVLKPTSTQLSGQIKSPKKRLAPAGKRQTSQPKAIYKPTQMTESSTIANVDIVTTSKASPDALINATQNLSTGEKNFQCSLCPYSSKNKGHVKRHIEIKHIPNSTVFKCRMCDKTCNLKYNLKIHYISKHGMPDDAAHVMVG